MIKVTIEVELEEEYGNIVKVYPLQEKSWWNTDMFLLPIMKDAVKQFLENRKYGIPGSLEIDFPNTKFDDQEKIWIEILNKMILAFDLIDQDNSCEFPHNEYGELDRVQIDENERKIEEGMGLFARYFRALWD